MCDRSGEQRGGCVCVQCGDCLGEETVSESTGPGFDGPVASARGQQVKQLGGRVGAVFDDCLSSAQATGGVKLLQGGEGTADDLLR